MSESKHLIPVSAIVEFDKQILKLNRKAAKLGCLPIVVVKGAVILLHETHDHVVETKLVEIRNCMTFIPAVATLLSATNPLDVQQRWLLQRWLLQRAGFRLDRA